MLAGKSTRQNRSTCYSDVGLKIRRSIRSQATRSISGKEIGVCLPQSIPQSCLRAPAQRCELRDIEALLRHTVGTGRIENDPSLIAHHSRNELGKINNRNFLSTADTLTKPASE